MALRYVRTTEDLVRFGYALRVDCTHCGSARTLNAKAAVKGLGSVELRGASRRFRCLRCGFKQATIKVLPRV